MQMRMNKRRRLWIAIAALVALVLLSLDGLTSFYVRWLWFDKMDALDVFWTVLRAKAQLALIFGTPLFLLMYLSVFIAQRNSPIRSLPFLDPRFRIDPSQLAQKAIAWIIGIVSLVIGGMVALTATGRWDDYLRFRNVQEFGASDPIFGVDIGFYVFRLPFLQMLQQQAFTIFMLVTLATAAVYFLGGQVELQPRLRVSMAARAHVSVLLAGLAACKGWDYFLDRYWLLLDKSTGAYVFGISYADQAARLPALNILMGIAVVAAVGFLLNSYLRVLWLPIGAVALMVVSSITMGGLYPSVVQRFKVQPQENLIETKFIEHHIAATRDAYGIAEGEGAGYLKVAEYAPTGRLTPEAARIDAETIANIRLADYGLWAATYDGLQSLRQYYHVSNLDIDRYEIDGQVRQIMLAPREVNTSALDESVRTWVNETLVYTHGYGIVASGVSEVGPEGRPVFLAQNLPLKGVKELTDLTRPEIYYGQVNTAPAIAPSKTAELDYPVGTAEKKSRYAGEGGLPIGSQWMRLVFAIYLSQYNVLISPQIDEDSRVLIHRDVMERAAQLAPFLKFDLDPYIVVEGGRLHWILDAYTISEHYPYSARLGASAAPNQQPGGRGAGMLELGPLGLVRTRTGQLNYLRNSVKVVVDAYSGNIQYYVSDSTDPLIKAYQQIFPDRFLPMEAMPAGLRAHVRYPEALFTIQAHLFEQYHVNNASVFYSQNDRWEVPQEQRGSQNTAAVPEGALPVDFMPDSRMEPYYVLARLPDEDETEYLMILPFKVRQKKNLAGWLAARCDAEHYGELRLYRLPSNAQIDGPEQVDNSIKTKPIISEAETLLGGRGSRIRYGNLIVLPIGGTMLYVKPMYVQAETQPGQTSYPELKRVILASYDRGQLRVVMQPTLAEALDDLVGGTLELDEEPSPPTPGPAADRSAPTPTASSAELIRQVDAALRAAETAQRAGDWAEYGRQMQRLRRAVRRLRDSAP